MGLGAVWLLGRKRSFQAGPLVIVRAHKLCAAHIPVRRFLLIQHRNADSAFPMGLLGGGTSPSTDHFAHVSKMVLRVALAV